MMNKGVNLFSFTVKPIFLRDKVLINRLYFCVLILSVITACQQEPYIRTFDKLSWQDDHNGCNGDRLGQLGLLIDQQNELIGWNESKITGFLGSPDYHELYVRNQKFLIYYIEPTLACGSEGKEDALRLYVRMDALGQSKEISLKNN